MKYVKDIFLRPLYWPLHTTIATVLGMLGFALVLNLLPGVLYAHQALIAGATVVIAMTLWLTPGKPKFHPTLLFFLYVVSIPISLTLNYIESTESTMALACAVAGMGLLYTATDWRLAWLGNVFGAVCGAAISIWLLSSMLPSWKIVFFATTLNTIKAGAAFLQSNVSNERRRLAKLSIGVTAHELRTPLFAMGLLCNDLKESALLNSHQRVVATSMLSLIDAMNITLDLQSNNAIESWTNVNQKDCDLDAMINKALANTFMSKSGRESVVISTHGRTSVFTNENLFISAIQNLIMNAERAVSQQSGGESIRSGDIVISTYMSEESFVEIEVADKGIGISRDKINKVFDDFFTTSGVPSNGLGLTMVKNTIQKMGGSVTVHSELGCGSIFRIRVPAKSL